MNKRSIRFFAIAILAAVVLVSCGNPSGGGGGGGDPGPQDPPEPITWNAIDFDADVPGGSSMNLEQTLTWIRDNAENGDDYTVKVKTAEDLPANWWLYYDRNYVKITLVSDSATERTIAIYGDENGFLFGIDRNVTLILDSYITLKGHAGNNEALVVFGEKGSLEMKPNSKIRGNENTNLDTTGGGVNVYKGSFTMTGGIIEDNKAQWSGGVSVYQSSFIMLGGTIKNNIAISGAGGVGVDANSIFTMSGGSIEYNTASWCGGLGVGGHSTFTMSSTASINHNEATADDCGGIAVDDGSLFTMTGGTISYNEAALGTGGVEIWESRFTMSGGTINNNKALTAGGGGVSIGRSQFTMSDTATITANEAEWGGGISINGETQFTMLGGTISYNEATLYDGGGIQVDGATFTKSGGSVQNNTAPSGTGANMQVYNGTAVDEVGTSFVDGYHNDLAVDVDF
jgi:hypothetical protein